VIGEFLRDPLNGRVHVEEQRPSPVVSYQVLDPEERRDAGAARDRRDVMQARGRIEHEVTSWKLQAVDAVGVFDDQVSKCCGGCTAVAVSRHASTGNVSLGVQILTWDSAASSRAESIVILRSLGSGRGRAAAWRGGIALTTAPMTNHGARARVRFRFRSCAFMMCAPERLAPHDGVR
jgi:hypothetical protein